MERNASPAESSRSSRSNGGSAFDNSSVAPVSKANRAETTRHAAAA